MEGHIHAVRFVWVLQLFRQCTLATEEHHFPPQMQRFTLYAYNLKLCIIINVNARHVLYLCLFMGLESERKFLTLKKSSSQDHSQTSHI